MNDKATDVVFDILIVDDTPANLRLLADMLTDHGYTVRLARSGNLALRGAQAMPPDLILLDIKMPEMNGFEVCKQLKKNPRTADIPIIFISALDQTEDKVQAFTYGGVDYITKPFHIEEVLARVQTHLTLYKLQRDLAYANEQLRASNAELNAYAHTVAHDLKSPLSVIMGFSSLLAAELDTLPEQTVKDALASIDKVSVKMRDIINSLLLLASVREAESVELEDVDMAKLVEDVLARLSTDIEAKTAQIKTPESWPVVRAYAPWLEEVWANYISNAIKYAGDANEGVAPQLELGAIVLEHSKTVRFFVRDNGLGLTAEQQAQVFVPFTRFHHRRAEGHGLGLSIVQRIIEKLEGQVGVDSEGPGTGSTFWFTLPAGE